MNLTEDDFDFSAFAPKEVVLIKEYLRRKAVRAKGEKFIDYVQALWPWFIVEAVHVMIADYFEKLLAGEIDRLMINMPPRTGKSVMTSEALPAWWIGHFPTDKILHTSYALGLVEKFGRKIRNSLADPAYQEMFPGTRLAKDSKASAQWATAVGGEYNAAGLGGGVAGKGWNLGIIDDPTSEQDAFSKTAHDNAFEWYGAGFYTRRQPDRNAVVVTQTRWRTDDLTGRLLEEERKDEGADKWTLLKIPAILDEEGADMLNEYANHPAIKVPCRYREGDSFAPQRWPLVEINRTINQISRKAQASLYRQSPTEEEGSILLRKWWQVWEGEPPKVEFVIQSYDTAFEESERNDFSARTTWGVFKYEKTNQYCAILLEAMEKRLNFPDLRQNAWESYQQYKPDRVIVEKKASGHSLIQELRKRGVPITASQAKGSKESRMDTASVPLEAGNVYYFDTRWANAVVDHCAVFPNGPNDDLADSVAHALIWLRKTFHLDARSDRRFDKDAPEDDANEKFAVTPQRSYAVRRTGTRMRIGERHG